MAIARPSPTAAVAYEDLFGMCADLELRRGPIRIGRQIGAEHRDHLERVRGEDGADRDAKS